MELIYIIILIRIQFILGLSEEELKQFCDIDDNLLGYWKNEGTAVKAKFVRQKCYLEQLIVSKVTFTGTKQLKSRTKQLKSKTKLTIKSYKKVWTKLKITCAGMPARCYHNVKWKTFKVGFTCGDKLAFKHVKGGVMLVETEYTIKESKSKKDVVVIEEKSKGKVTNKKDVEVQNILF